MNENKGFTWKQFVTEGALLESEMSYRLHSMQRIFAVTISETRTESRITASTASAALWTGQIYWKKFSNLKLGRFRRSANI